MAFDLIKNKEHLTIEGLKKLIAIKASLNLGLSEELKKAFPTIVTVLRPVVVNQTIPDPQWVAGFTSGEGCFFINIFNSKTKIGFGTKLSFQITQHSRDEQLMKSLIVYFGCGSYTKRKEGLAGDFRVTKFEDIFIKIIPFFQRHQLIGEKIQDFQDWCKCADLIKAKRHLTEEGLEETRKLKARMNKGRK
nr:hypothetical protein [Arthrobotrys musiformis]QBM31497.1 hypothetical protein [Arthrobotrys musiformis]QBM31647.1 hypothetical protein [Arthrobotrys musiformis]